VSLYPRVAVFDWLLDNATTVYSLLIVAALVCVVAWWRTRRHAYLVALGVVGGLAGLYALLFLLIETPRQQIERKVNEMAAAVAARDADAILRNVSDDFRHGGMDKAGLRGLVEKVLRQRAIDGLQVWDFDWPESAAPRTRPVHFRAKPLGGMASGEAFYLVKATFVRDPDGQWRLKGFDVFNPFVNTTQPFEIPSLP
jgi:hypothetical protein